MFFFFKQKTAYEIEYVLVGSEMCIRDRFGVHAGLSSRRSRVQIPSGPLRPLGGIDNTVG